MRTPDYAAKAVELLEKAEKSPAPYTEGSARASANLVAMAEVYAYLHRTLLEAEHRA